MQISELFSMEIYDQAVMYFFAPTGGKVPTPLSRAEGN